MAAQREQGSGRLSDVPPLAELLQPLRAAFSRVQESDRYRLLAGLLAALAEDSGEKRPHGSGEEVEALSRRIQTLSEEKASLQDQCAALKADLARRTTQLEAEQTRGKELEAITGEQRSRLEALQKTQRDVETQLSDRNAELHKFHLDNEQLLLRLQRAELGRGDEAAAERLEGAKRQLGKEVEALRGDLQQLRVDKDAEIARLTEELAKSRSTKSGSEELPVAMLWERLAAVNPPLVERRTVPTRQCAERLADDLIELVRFVDDFDQLIRPFLSKYTKHNPQVKVPWEVYASRDNTRRTVEQTLAVTGGKPVGVLKIRLRGLYAWTEAAMIGCDAAVESVASELQSFLMGPQGAGAEPNRTIREFLRNDGHELFLQHVRDLRGLKMAEAFGRGG